MKGNRGFTIVELMIVITIVAVGITLAVPSFNDLIERKAVGGAAEAAYEQLQIARSQAVKRSKPILVDFYLSGTNWAIGLTDKITGCNAEEEDATDINACTVDYDNVADVSTDDDFLMRIQGTDFKDITMSKASGFANSVTWTTINWSNGCKAATNATLHDERTCFDFMRALSRTGTFDFASANYKLRLQVDQLGHVNICVNTGEKGVVGYDAC